MTRLKRIRLRNICNIQELDLELGPGIIGVLGPNGSGKSTLLNSAYAALTNDFSWHHAGKSGVPTLGAKGIESFVEIELDTDAGPVKLTRRLSPSVESVLEMGDRRTESVAEIASVMRSVVGASPSVIRNFIFVEQWQLFSFLTAPPAVRLEFLSAICDTERLESCWKHAGDMLAEDQKRDTSPVITGRLTGIEESISGIRSAIAQNELKAAETVGRLESCGPVSVHENVIRAADACQRTEDELTQRKAVLGRQSTRLQGVEDSLESVGRELSELTASLDQDSRKLDELEAERDRLSSAAVGLAERRGVAKALTDCRRDGVRQQKTVDELVAEKKAMQADRRSSADLSKMRNEVRELELLIQASKSGKDVCPTCMSPIARPASFKGLGTDELVRLLKLRTDEIAGLEVLLAQRSRVELNLDFAKKQADFLTRQASELADQLNALPEHDEDAERKWRKARADVQGLRSARDAAKPRLSALRQAVENLQREKASLAESVRIHSERIVELETVLSSAPSVEAVRLARDAVRVISSLRSELTSVKAVIKSQTEMLADRESALEKARKELEDLEPLRNWIDRLHSIRGQFHRDAIPRSATLSTLSALAGRVNQTLAQFGAPFTAEVSEQDVQFMGRFPSGLVGPRSLSGAQKVMLALAIRLSVGFGFLALDEPTAGLDLQTLSHIIESIHRMRDRIRNAGGQVLIVTHESSLLRVFDQVVRLRGVG